MSTFPVTQQMYHRICKYQGCQKPFSTTSSTKLHCKDSHRQLAYKERKGIPLPLWETDRQIHRKRIPSETEIKIAALIAQANQLEADYRQCESKVSPSSPQLQAIEQQLSEYKRIVDLPAYKEEKKETFGLIRKFIPFVLRNEKPVFSTTTTGSRYRENFDKLFQSTHANLYSFSKLFPDEYTALVQVWLERRMENEWDLSTVNDLKDKHLRAIGQYRIENLERKKAAELESISLRNQTLATQMAEIRQQNDTINAEIETLRSGYAREEIVANKEAVSIGDILTMNFETFDFTDIWYNLFGKPEKGFRAFLHGARGTAKTHQALAFAKYFCGFGSVLYFSYEQNGGLSSGFQQAAKDVGITAGLNINVLQDPKKPKQIASRAQVFDLVIIDSITTVNFTEADLSALLRLCKPFGTSFLFLGQHTKGNDYAGGAAIAHLVDIEIEALHTEKAGVHTYTTKVVKNRYEHGTGEHSYHITKIPLLQSPPDTQ
jgi:hypothetical protein